MQGDEKAQVRGANQDSVFAPASVLLHTSPGRKEVRQVEQEKTPRERTEDLISLFVSDWRPTPQQGVWAGRIALILVILVVIGYAYNITLWDWAKLPGRR